MYPLKGAYDNKQNFKNRLASTEDFLHYDLKLCILHHNIPNYIIILLNCMNCMPINVQYNFGRLGFPALGLLHKLCSNLYGKQKFGQTKHLIMLNFQTYSCCQTYGLGCERYSYPQQNLYIGIL